MLSVTLRQLEVLRSVVETGSFSGAASALDISQPSVSMHIRALESHLREQVFERRRGQSPTLTDIGRRVYDHAEDILTRSDRAMTDIRSLQSVREDVLSFAAHRFIGNHLLSKPLAIFARDNPGIEIIANIGALDQAIAKIRHRDVDLGLFLSLGESNGIRSEILGHQRLAFLAAPDHPLASRRRLGYRDLADQPFIGPVRGTEYARLLHCAFETVGFANHNTITQSQNTLIRRELLLSGVGFSCVLRSGWTDDLHDGRLVVLDVAGDPLSIEVRVGFLPDRIISKASRRFLAYLGSLKAEGAFDN